MARKYKWEIYVDKVVGGMSQVDAYKSTYKCDNMSENAIAVEASALLYDDKKYPKSSLRFSELNKKAREKDDNNAIADATEVLRYLTSVMRGEDKQESYVQNAMGELEKLETKNQVNQIRAAELLGKRYGLYTDKIESEIETEIKISIDYGDSNDSD